MVAKTFQQHDLASILQRLLNEHHVNPNILEKRTGIPRSTIQNILNGKTTDPRISTLNTIANYFGIDVNQLLGSKPLDDQPKVVQHLIPILPWKTASSWQQTIADTETWQQHAEKVAVDITLEKNQFALKVVDDVMYPLFQKGSILIINPEKQAKNGDFVVAYINQLGESILRQLFLEGEKKILKASNHTFPTIEMNNADSIVGVIVQVRNEYD